MASVGRATHYGDIETVMTAVYVGIESGGHSDDSSVWVCRVDVVVLSETMFL